MVLPCYLQKQRHDKRAKLKTGQTLGPYAIGVRTGGVGGGEGPGPRQWALTYFRGAQY